MTLNQAKRHSTQSGWPLGLRRGSAAAHSAGIVGSNPVGGHGYLSVASVVCCKVEVPTSGPIPRPEESHRVWCV